MGWRRGLAVPATVAMAVSLLGGCGGGDSGGGDESAAEGAATTTTTVSTGAAALDEAEVLIADEMDDDANGWGEIDVPSFVSGFDDGAYIIEPRVAAQPILVFPDALGADVVDARVATTVTTDVAGFVGVYCRAANAAPFEWYTLAVQPATGDYSIDRWFNDSPENFEPTTLIAGRDDALVAATSEIVGTCQGEDGGPIDLTLSVGGEVVAEATDDDGLGVGTAGVAAMAVDENGTFAPRFEDFEVRGTRAEAGGAGTGDSGSGDSGAVVFEDDFSEPGGIATLDDPPATASVEDGSFVHAIAGGSGTPGYNVTSPLPVALMPDHFQAEVTATVASSGRAYGGFCIGDQARAVYTFEVSSEGAADIVRIPDVSQSAFTFLAGGPEPTSGVNPTVGVADPQPNHLVLDYDGTDPDTIVVTLTVNDEVVLEASDADPLAVTGPLTLCTTKSALAPAGATVTAAYDDLVVTDLG